MTLTPCPQCGSTSVEQTLVAILDDRPYRDSNRAKCTRCGWAGTLGDWQLIDSLRTGAIEIPPGPFKVSILGIEFWPTNGTRAEHARALHVLAELLRMSTRRKR